MFRCSDLINGVHVVPITQQFTDFIHRYEIVHAVQMPHLISFIQIYMYKQISVYKNISAKVQIHQDDS